MQRKETHGIFKTQKAPRGAGASSLRGGCSGRGGLPLGCLRTQQSAATASPAATALGRASATCVKHNR